jgi:hypothetical protein
MFRFDAKTGYFLYPEANNKSELRLKLNRGSTYDKVSPREDICVIKLGLNIPKEAGNYEEFVKQMNDSEKKFVNQMNESEKEFFQEFSCLSSC